MIVATNTYLRTKKKDAEEKPGGTGKNKRRATGLPQPQFFSEIPEMNKLDQINE